MNTVLIVLIIIHIISHIILETDYLLELKEKWKKFIFFHACVRGLIFIVVLSTLYKLDIRVFGDVILLMTAQLIVEWIVHWRKLYGIFCYLVCQLLYATTVIIVYYNDLINRDFSPGAITAKEAAIHQLNKMEFDFSIHTAFVWLFALLILWKVASAAIGIAIKDFKISDSINEKESMATIETSYHQCSCGNVTLIVKDNIQASPVLDKSEAGTVEEPIVQGIPEVKLKEFLKFYAASFSSAGKSGGERIGIAERMIVFILVLSSQYTAIAFVVAAKAIARHDKISKDIAFGDKFLLGTFMSIIFSVLTALFCKRFA